MPSWAAEEGNTTAASGQTRYSQGRTAGVSLARSENHSSDKNDHRVLPQTPRISIRKANNIYQHHFYRDPKELYGMTGVTVIIFLLKLHPILKAAKFTSPTSQRVIYKLSHSVSSATPLQEHL